MHYGVRCSHDGQAARCRLRRFSHPQESLPRKENASAGTWFFFHVSYVLRRYDTAVLRTRSHLSHREVLFSIYVALALGSY